MPTKQKWEYRIEGGIVGGSILVELNKLGDEGWELTAMYPIPPVVPKSKNTVYYFFKRLKA